MNRLPSQLSRTAAILGLGLAAVFSFAGSADAQDQVKRGEYLARAGGCFSCHTDETNKGPELAGGRAMKTPFGTFVTPNITADKATGIGNWTDSQFLNALKRGVRPDGANYFPVFPYPTYTKMTDADALAIKAYLLSRPGVARPNRPHEVGFPFSLRFLQFGWKLMFFTPGDWQDAPDKPAEYNRGGYLVEALSHCGECHTPRNPLGGLDRAKAFSGTRDGPDGSTVPNITPDKDTGIGPWTKEDIANLLKTAETPDFASVRKSMLEAIEDGLKYLTDADRLAIATYILAQKPIRNDLRKAP